MWTAQEFANVLEKHPNGGTFWTGSHRVVRYIRVLRPAEGVIVSVMTQMWRWKEISEDSVELFVKTPTGTEVAEFSKAEKTEAFLEKLLSSSILNLIEPGLLPEVKKFIPASRGTYLPTW